MVPKQTISIDARSESALLLELCPLVEVGDAALSVMLVVRLHDVGAMEQTASCTVTLRRASVTVDGTVLRGAPLCRVGFDAQTATPALLLAETDTPVAEMALSLEWSQGSSTSAAQDIVFAVDVVERRAPVRTTAMRAGEATPAQPSALRRAAGCDETTGTRARRTARRAATPTLTVERGDGATLYRVLDKRTFDIDGDTRELVVPLATRIPAVDSIDAVLVARIHSLTWPTEGTPTLAVQLRNESIAPEQPSLDFVDRESVVASIDIDDSVTAPALLVAGASRMRGIGDHLRVELAWASTSTYPASITLGVDLVARARRRPFEPLDIDGCVLWLRADRGISTIDGAVDEWADQSDNGNDARQTTASQRPTYEPAGWSNGRPALDFDRANIQALSLPTGMSYPSDDYTFVVVLDQRSPTTSPQDILVVDGVNPAWLIALVTNSSVQPGIWDHSAWRGCGSAPVAGEQALMWVLDSSGPTFEVFRNGASIGSAAYVNDVTWTNPVIGRNGSSQAIDAKVAEIILYNRVIDEDERERLDEYLSRRYAL